MTAATAPASAGAAAPQLHRVLGTMSLALFSVGAIVGLRWLSFAAQIGPSSLVLWVLGLLCYMLPMALAVLELSSRMPGEGGLYLWAKAAFGDAAGFVAGWAFWVSNLVYFPTLLLFAAGGFLFIGGSDWLAYKDSTAYNATFCFVILWAVTLVNIVGLSHAKLLTGIGGSSTWIIGSLLLVAGIVAWVTLGPQSVFTPASFVPDFRAFATWTAFATIALAYEGLELGPILGGEIMDPKRTIARATLIASVIVAAVYILGTTSLLIALPHSEIDLINGVPQALAAVGAAVHIPAFGTLTAILITVSSVGGLTAWISGTARLPFVFGLDRYMPRAMGNLHPRYHTPYVSILVQSIIVTLVLIASFSGSAIHEAFLALLDMTIVLSLAPSLFIFASLPVLRAREGKRPGVFTIPGGVAVSVLLGVVGFATTLLAIIVALIPPDGTDATWFFIKVFGGTAILVGVGFAFYARGRMRDRGRRTAG